MARKRYNTAEEWNRSLGYSDESLTALKAGKYDQMTGRDPQYRTSADQVRAARELPVLDGLLPSIPEPQRKFGRRVDTEGARRNYEQSIGHFGRDVRNLREQGYDSSYNDIDFSKLSDFDKEYLDADLDKWNKVQESLEKQRGYAPDSPGAKFENWRRNNLLGSDDERIANAQVYVDKFGRAREDVLKAYQIYKESQERKAREETPYKAGLKDFVSAPDRGLANAVKRFSNEYFTGSDLEKLGDDLQKLAGAEKVEKQRDYSRKSDKISDLKKAFLDPYFQYGDLASSELAGALLGGGMAMADPAAGFGLSIEPMAGLGTAFKTGTGYGLTAQEKYDELIKQGVDPEKASSMANMSGLSMAAAMAAGKAIPSLGADASLPTRILTNGGISGTVMAARQAADQIADMLILGDQSAYNGKVQNYMAQGKSEAEAHKAARNDLLASDLGSYLFGLLTGAGSELTRSGLSKALSEGVNKVDDTLNSVWDTQPALEQKDIPRLTGTVNNTQALPGNGQLPALVDNIYPIQMPGTQGVIPMPGTNGVILPTVGGASAPVSRTMNEAAGWVSPRLVKALEGAELEKAKQTIATNEKRIDGLKTEIAQLIDKKNKSSYYRGNLKKAVEKDVAAREKEMKKLIKTNKDLTLQVKGGMKPMLDMLTREQKNAIYDTSGKHDSVFSKINFAAKFAGDTPEAKALALQAQNAIRKYVKTGSFDAVKEMTTALQELDNMAKTVNATYTSSAGNEWNYDSAFGKQAKYLEGLQPVGDIYNAETRAARAAQNVPQTAGESAPVEAPAPVNYPAPKGDTSLIPQTHAGTSEPLTRDLYVKRYTTKDSSDTGKSRGLFVSNESTPSPHQDMGDDLRHYAVKAGAKVYDTAFNGKLQTSRYGSPVQVSTNVNYLVDKWGENTVQNLLDLPREELIRSLEEDLGGIFNKGKDNLEILENVGAFVARRDGIDVLRTVDSDYGASQGILESPEDFTEMAVLNDSVLQRVGDTNQAGTSAPIKASSPQTNIVSQTPQNVNTIPEVTNEPNFTTVGNPYTPQEVPNVQPTPPTNNVPPTQEVPNMDGGNMKTSQYYKNTMRNMEANRDLSDEDYANRYNEDFYKYMTISEQQSVGMAHDFINESGGDDAAIQKILSGDFDSDERFSGYHLDAVHILRNKLEKQIKELEANGQDASSLIRLSDKLHQKVREWDTYFGQALQANQKWKKSTPQGAYDNLISEIDRGIDKKKTTGYTRNVNNLVNQIEDAIENTEDKATLISKIKDIFAKDREKNPYNTQKAEQLVLNLVGGDKNTKKSVSDLIEDASRVIKKEMGVSTLSPKDERAIVNLLDEASKLEPGTRPYNVLVSRAMTIVDDSLPVTVSEKVKSLLYDNMLASIKTMFTRNFGGNLVGNAIDAMAAPFQVGADALVGKFTGVRTRALTGKSIIAAAKGMGHGFSEWGQDIGYSIKNKTAFNTARSGQEELADVLKAVHKTWKTQSQNKAVKAMTHALSAYDYIIRKGMEGGDRPIYEAQYAATKAELYHVVDKYGDAGLRKGLPADKRDLDTDDLIEAIAINEGLEAVLQNDSKMKEAAKNFKAAFKNASEDMFGIDIASMAHAPFVEVPANMASNFFKLTPVGWIGNAKRTFNEKRKYGSINQRRFTGELGLNVLGGLLGVGGFAAADKFISGPYSDDPNERKLQQNNGYLEYALQTPDGKHQVDISDIPYLGPGLKFTKMERDAYNENGVKGMLEELPAATGAATVDTLFQSLNRLTGADFQTGGSGNFLKNAWNNIKSSPGSMFIPSYVRQTAQFLDPYKRDLGDYGTSEYNKNLVINGIPLLRQAMLEPKIDTAGQKVPELGGSTGVGRFMSAYVNPYKVSHPHENMSAVQEYINGLKQSTDGAVNPQMRAISKKDITGIKGYNKENYNHADLRRFQEEYYNLNTELGNTLIQDPWFTNLSEEKQGKILEDLWGANLALVKENFVRNGLTEEQIAEAGEDLYTTDNKLAATIRDDDEKHTGLLQWLHDETDRNALNAKYGTDMNHDNYVKYNERGENYAEQRMSETEIAKSLGMTVDSYEKYEKQYPTGAKGYAEDKQAALDYGFVDSDNSANVDAYNIAKELGNGDPTVIQAYSDYKQEGIKSNAYGAKAGYLANEDRLTDEQKGMIIAGSQDGSKVSSLAGGAKQLYDIGGYAGINYYYLIKSIAEPTYGTSLSKKERAAFFAEDHPELDALWNYEQTPGDKKGQEMYYYLQANLK